ncbi:hypothetical protein QCA50_014867 [Cerrena zonata]|uniref:Vomeronasal type-1 receptor n=1 Tax=Cerrena zonata TaxID=2478898 RepID=A0AAW0FSQ5_9APHY
MSNGSSPNILEPALLNQKLHYIAFATVSLLVYDVLLGLLEDIRILLARAIKLTDAIYILARVLALGEAGVICANAALPVPSCHQGHVLLAAKCLVAVIIPCNSWLFLLRIRALSTHFCSRTTVTMCTVLWTLTFTSFLIFPGFKVSDLPNQDGTCELIATYNNKLLCTPFIAQAIFDTAVMVAISIGFVRHSPGPSWNEKLKSTILIKHMGHISGLFLRSGQIYYLTTIGIHLTMAVIASSSAIPPDYIGQLSLLTSTFHSIMTCRVFRLLKLSQFDQSSDATFFRPATYSAATSPIAFQGGSNNSHTSASWDQNS